LKTFVWILSENSASVGLNKVEIQPDCSLEISRIPGWNVAWEEIAGNGIVSMERDTLKNSPETKRPELMWSRNKASRTNAPGTISTQNRYDPILKTGEPRSRVVPESQGLNA
jgi:hypothetical protein